MTMRAASILVLAFLLAVPLGFAHTDQGGPGTPDFTCQTPQEWRVHDYAPPAQADILVGVDDGNLEECGTTYGFTRGAHECRELEDRFDAANPASPAHAIWLLLCQTDQSADFDGDFEFAIGGALLAVESGDGETSGSIVCYGVVGHHTADITVEDILLNPVAFTIAADASLVPPPSGEPDCGDGTITPCQPGPSPIPTSPCNPNDHILSCPIQNSGTCTASFEPGTDGMYYVFVGRMARPALGGHVYTG